MLPFLIFVDTIIHVLSTLHFYMAIDNKSAEDYNIGTYLGTFL